MTAIFQLDGVLRGVNEIPIMSGRFLLEALRSVGRAVVITDGPRDSTEQWLRLNNLKVDDIIDGGVLIDPLEEPLVRLIQVARARGKVDYVVVTDPAAATWCLDQGVVCLLFVASEHMIPTARPGHPSSRRSWMAIQDEMDRRIKAKD